MSGRLRQIPQTDKDAICQFRDEVENNSALDQLAELKAEFRSVVKSTYSRLKQLELENYELRHAIAELQNERKCLKKRRVSMRKCVVSSAEDAENGC